MAELAGVGVACSALDETSKGFAVLFEVLEVFCWSEGWFYAVSYCIPAHFRGVFPFPDPNFVCGDFGSSFSIGPGSAEWDLAVEGGGLLR